MHKFTFKASMDLAIFSQYVSEGADPLSRRTKDACTCYLLKSEQPLTESPFEKCHRTFI